MNCELIFKIGEEEISFIMDSTSPLYPHYNEILRALKNPLNKENKEKLFSYIKENYNGESIQMDLDKVLENPEGLIGNTTIAKLSAQNPDILFPEGVNAQVLQVQNLKIGGRTISGRIINSNGQELFIINKKDDIIKLAGFLTIRKILEENPSYFDENSKNYKDLEILRVMFKKSSIPDLILDFIEYTKNNKSENKLDKNIFRTKYFTDQNGTIQSVYNFLDKIAREIQQYNQVVQYENEFVNAISRLHRVRNDNNKAIKYNELYEAVKAFYKDKLKLFNIKNKKDFVKLMLKTDVNYEEYGYDESEIIKDKPFIFTFLNSLIKDEKRYKYKIINAKSDEIILKYEFDTLQSTFGFNYEAIHTFDLINSDYKGYKIYAFNYNNEKIYIYSRNYLTEDTPIYKTFKSEDEIKQYLDTKVLDETLKTNSFIRFKFRNKVNGVYDPSQYIYKINNSSQLFKVGSIVESLNIVINPNTDILHQEYLLINSSESKVSDIHKLIDTWNIEDNFKISIKNYINNAEKAVTFIYKINELLKFDRTNGEELNNIAKDINNASKVAYYINSNNKNNYTLIPTEPNIVEEYKKDKSVPVVTLLEAMKTVLQKKIGINVNLLTSSQISKLFPITGDVKIDPNTSKAFIYDNQIYINTTIASGEDLLHEYTHIILGILKSNPDSRQIYEQLINTVWINGKKNEVDQAKRDYEGRFEMDIREEFFVRKFSEYLLRNQNGNLDEIFKQQEVYIKDGTKIIFDLIGDETLPSIFSKNLNTLFNRFSSDIATLLKKENGLDFDLIKETRKKVTFINQQISEGKITEIC